ncbi:MAG: tRNA lysidine(34) synthetase TilS [Steroidobacteraceae bacterium]
MLHRIRELARDPQRRLHCTVAWSGGLDSTVLLHILMQARRRLPTQLSLRAVHVDHGLQAAAADFRRFCRSTARDWKVPLTVIKAHVRLAGGESVEEAARTARYAALADALLPGELLLTAQHADDQLETLLLALLRGAGPAGLAAMPQAAAFGSTLLLRPLLNLERGQLTAYAARHQLSWRDDPSNEQLRFDRNYLRARVLPLLRERWPAVARTASRSAGHCAVAAAALSQSARRDLEAAVDGPDLEIAVLRRWPPARRAAVLRLWIADQGLQVPELRHIEQIAVLMDARPDARPELRLPEFLVRRHAGRLVLELRSQRRDASPCRIQRWSWRRGALQLAGGRLEIVAGSHGDLDLARLPQRLLVQYPSVPAGRALRKLMQELGVPDWQRERLPLIFAAGRKAAHRPLAIADLWLTEDLRSTVHSVRRGRIFWRELR